MSNAIIEVIYMKRNFLLLSEALVLAIVPYIALAQIHFTATLDGTQEVPAVVTTATGTGSFELSEDFTELRYFVSYQGLNAAGVDGHFHQGNLGVNGAVVRNIQTPTTTSGTFNGIWKSTDSEPLTRSLVDSLLNGKVFFDLHDSKNMTGEIRGQLILETSLHFEVNYDAAHENPPVSATGGGTGVFVLDKTRTQVDYWVTYHGLTGPLTSGGQILVGPPGTNGPVVRTIAEIGNPASATVKGSWKTTDSQPLTAALVDSLIAGKLYSNFCTLVHADGEIRGQLVLRSGIGFISLPDSSQENPPTFTHASGTGSFILNEAHNQLTYNLTYIGLSSNLTSGSHIHIGRIGTGGVNDSIVKTLALSGGAPEATISGTWQITDAMEFLTPSLVDSLLAGVLYADFHTTADNGGEIRGQINLTTGIGFTSVLSAKEIVPPIVQSNGTGTASVVLSPDRQSILYSLTYLNLTSTIAGAGGHFHEGARGTNGGLVKVIVPAFSPGAFTIGGVWSTSDADLPLTPDIVDLLVAGDIYINLHTGDYIAGEIRGQVSYNFDVPTSVIEVPSNGPGEFRLEQNYPNPFNPTTTISFSIPSKSFVTLKVFDLLGRELADIISEEMSSGNYSRQWNAAKLSSGVYFYRLQAGSFFEARKLILLR
jgi:hypothetical protein